MEKGMVLSLITVLVAAIVVLAILLWPRADEQPLRQLEVHDASLFISDAGTAFGGFEFTAMYNVSVLSDNSPMMSDGERVTLKFTLDVGLGDPIADNNKDETFVTVKYEAAEDRIRFDGKEFDILLLHFENDTIWNHAWDGYYIASWGGYAPDEEIRGEISPTIFGLPEHYYVELRMDITIHHLEPDG